MKWLTAWWKKLSPLEQRVAMFGAPVVVLGAAVAISRSRQRAAADAAAAETEAVKIPGGELPGGVVPSAGPVGEAIGIDQLTEFETIWTDALGQQSDAVWAGIDALGADLSSRIDQLPQGNAPGADPDDPPPVGPSQAELAYYARVATTIFQRYGVDYDAARIERIAFELASGMRSVDDLTASVRRLAEASKTTTPTKSAPAPTSSGSTSPPSTSGGIRHTLPAGIAALGVARIAGAVKKAGHNYGTSLDPGDVMAACRRVGHNPGTRLDVADVQVLFSKTGS